MSECCDDCIEERLARLAVIYCTTCAKKYCEEHQQSHEGHSKMNVDDYKSQVEKLAIRMCDKHSDKPCIQGCKVCLTIRCGSCLGASMEDCSEGTPHQFCTIDKLVAEINNQIGELRVKVSDKEKELSALSNTTSEFVSGYETKTEEMIKEIHETRDEQLEAIRDEYDKLEEELVERRDELKNKMMRFMEEDVGVKLFDLSKHQLMIEAGVRNSHQVDVVSDYRDPLKKLNTLLADDMPSIDLEGTPELRTTQENRAIELKIDSGDEESIEWERQKTLCYSKPLGLIKSVNVFHPPITVCHYQGSTYVGSSSGKCLVEIRKHYEVINPFLTLPEVPRSVRVHEDRIYTLLDTEPYTVIVHDMLGTEITRWTIPATCYRSYIQFAIVADKLVIPDLRGTCLILYSLTGEKINDMPCLQLSGGSAAMCSAGADSIIISDFNSSKVSRIDITSGNVIWTSEHVSDPRGVTCYGEHHVLVAGDDNEPTIWMLDIVTGDLLSLNVDVFKDHTTTFGSHTYDLHVVENTLIVPRPNDLTVLFYDCFTMQNVK